MPIFTIKTPLSHDGKLLAVGETVDLSDADAAPLLKLDALEPAPDKPGPKKPGPGAKAEA